MYIGIDLGTTACKVVLFDADGSIVSEFNREYPLICNGDFVEQDAELWWELICDGIKTVSLGCGHAVRAISVSTQGIAFVPVDRDGRTLSYAISWLDMRAADEVKLLEERVGRDYVYRSTGKFLNAEYTLPKLMWLRRNMPELYDAAAMFLLPLDFVNMRLCGCPVCDYTVAGGTMAFDIANKRYDETLLDAAGIDGSRLPSVACMGERLGVLLPSVADMLGLGHECAVYLGGQDQKLAAIGAGIDEKSITVSIGTATAVTKLVPSLSDTVDFSRFRFNNDYFSYEGVVSTSGAALKWARDTIFGSLSYAELDRIAALAGSSAGVTFKTELTTGGRIDGLTLATTTGNIVYALFEGVSQNIADFVRKMGGCEYLSVFGGGAKSDIWCQILANTAKITVCALSTPETASLGAAILASNGSLAPAKVERKYIPE